MSVGLPILDLAAHWHAGQRRKGSQQEPFVLHPLRVAGLLIEHGLYDADLQHAALLHDILEDTGCPPGEIRKEAGDNVLGWVMELTDRKELLKSMRKQMQVERAELLSREAKLIRLADKIDNVADLQRNPPADWSWQRIRDYVAWADRVVRAMGEVHPGLENRYRRTRNEVWHWATGQPPLPPVLTTNMESVT